jgi:hypothetical protein
VRDVDLAALTFRIDDDSTRIVGVMSRMDQDIDLPAAVSWLDAETRASTLR